MTEVLVVAFIILIPGIPGCVIGNRSGVERPWVAFIPIVGFWIVLLQSTNHSGWIALVAVIPLASLALVFWTALELPAAQGRSMWWVFALIIPGIHLLGWWFYAFTLPKSPAEAASHDLR